MITLNDIHHWARLGTEGIDFPAERSRICTLDFNVAGAADIYIWLSAEDKPRLLAHVVGRDTVKFVTPGAYQIINKTPDVDVWVLTRDGTVQHRVTFDEKKFTTLHEPVGEDPQLAKVMEAMDRKYRRREAALRAEVERMVNADRAGTEQAADAGETAAGDDGKGQSPASDKPVPSKPVSEGGVQSDDKSE